MKNQKGRNQSLAGIAAWVCQNLSTSMAPHRQDGELSEDGSSAGEWVTEEPDKFLLNRDRLVLSIGSC